MPITNFSFLLQEGKPPQGQERPDHVFPHPLGLQVRLGLHVAMANDMDKFTALT